MRQSFRKNFSIQLYLKKIASEIFISTINLKPPLVGESILNNIIIYNICPEMRKLAKRVFNHHLHKLVIKTQRLGFRR